jgi:hypothetical protein
MESTLKSASAGLFECDFLSKAARDTRHQKFTWVVRALSGPLSAQPHIYETTIDHKIFASHPSCREPLLEAPPDGAAREPR